MLSDHEQRALEELERCFRIETQETVASRPVSRPPGRRLLAVMACPVVVLLLLGAALAALALATAVAIGWLSWRLLTTRTHSGVADAWMQPGTGHGGRRSAPGAGESVRQYLRWLAEAE